MTLTRRASAASGISGWIAPNDAEKEKIEDRDEVATTNHAKQFPNYDVDLSLPMGGTLDRELE